MFYAHSQCPKIRIMKLFITLENTNVNYKGSTPNPPSVEMDFSARGPFPNLVAYPTSLPVSSLSPTFTLYSPLQNEDGQRGNIEDIGDGRSFGQLAM